MYHQKSSVIKANSFNTLNTFENRYAEFEWISISLMPVLSKEHRNTYATYNAEMANYVITKIIISNLKYIDNNSLSLRVYDLDDFDDQVKLYGQDVAYISNGSSAKAFLDFSNNKEVQNGTSRQKFFTNQDSKRLHIDLREQGREDIHVGIAGSKLS